MKKLQPLHNHALIKLKEKEEKSESGLYMPTNDFEKNNHGEVMDISKLVIDGKELDCHVKVGDMVYFRPHCLIELEENVYLIKILDILAKKK